jgi:hypothetical protein
MLIRRKELRETNLKKKWMNETENEVDWDKERRNERRKVKNNSFTVHYLHVCNAI